MALLIRDPTEDANYAKQPPLELELDPYLELNVIIEWPLPTRAAQKSHQIIASTYIRVTTTFLFRMADNY